MGLVSEGENGRVLVFFILKNYNTFKLIKMTQ